MRSSGLAALITLTLLLGGCGGSATNQTDSSGASFRWLASTSGSPPSVADENRRPGTTAWQLDPAAARSPRLSAYVSEQSARPGDHERIYVDAPGSRWLSLKIFRMGWYGGRGARLVLESARLPVRSQPPCRHSDSTGLTECRWHPTLALTLPASLASGVYVVKLTDSRGDQRDCMFVLEALQPAAMLAQIPVATYEAYNNWGGDSLYPGYQRVAASQTKQGVEVSFDRPYDSATGAGQLFKGDISMVRFLEARGYPVSYTTGVSVDRRPAQLTGRRVVVDVGHSEYWSARAAQAFASARDRGVNLAFMSSDTLAWRIRLEPAGAASSEAGSPAHRIVGYKEYVANDPNRANPSGAFPDLGASLTGSAYGKCITPSAARGVYRYYAWHPSPALTPDWLYRGSGLRPSSAVAGIVGYELDARTSASPAGAIVVGTGTAACRGGPTTGIAETTLYRAGSGALVFATGTLGWQFGLEPLASVSPDVPRAPDSRLVKLTDNLFVRMLRR
ncbi:MAG: hypothetical protein NVS2B6_10760 [Thermoleophilaceae bacterium]